MSARFSTRVVMENFNVLTYTRELEAKMREIIKEGAKRFMVETLKRIPLDTGFLRGSFLNLEYLLGSAAGRFEKVTRKASANKGVNSDAYTNTSKGKNKKRAGNINDILTDPNKKIKPQTLIEKTTGTRRRRKPKKDGTTTYERFIPAKGARDVNDINEIRRLEKAIRRIQDRQARKIGKASLSSRTKKEARARLREEFKQAREELALLADAYRKGKLSTAEYIKAVNAKRYRTVRKLKSNRQANLYIARLVEARYNRARNQTKQTKRALAIIAGLEKRRAAAYKRIAIRADLIDKDAKNPLSNKEIRQEVKSEFPILKTGSKNRNKPLYFYSPGRTNYKRDDNYLQPKLKYYYYRPGGGFRVLKTPLNARTLGTPLDKIFIFGSKRIVNGKSVPNYKVGFGPSGEQVRAPVVGFNFETQVRYLAHNDVHLGWNAWQAGMAAFQKYVLAELDKESRLEQYVNITYSQHGNERSEQQVRSNFASAHKATKTRRL